MRTLARFEGLCALAGGAIVVGAVAALPATAQAFRTGADLQELDGTKYVRWATPIVPFVLNSDLPADIDSGELQELVIEAFSTWHAVECSDVGLSFEGFSAAPAAPGDGHNTVQWIDSGWAEHGFAADAGAVTDTQYARDENDEWAIVEADLYLNGEYFSWSLDRDGDRDIGAVLTHTPTSAARCSLPSCSMSPG
jgi:hypothetical protein